MRFSKRQSGSIRSLEAHNERQKNEYKSNPDIDVTRQKDNYHLVQAEQNYRREIAARIECAGCKTRKDSVLLVEALITGTPEFINKMRPDEQRDYFEHALHFFEKEIGPDNIVAAVVHMDERTPHMHLCFTPITPDKKLSAKIIIGNREKLCRWQDNFHEHMSSRWSELERGTPAMESGRKHIPGWMLKRASALDMQRDHVKKSIDELHAFNAGSKRKELQKELSDWYNKSMSFVSQLGSMKNVLESTERELRASQSEACKLKEIAERADWDKRMKNVELMRLQQTFRDQQALLALLSEDTLALLRKQARAEKGRSTAQRAERGS